MDDNERRKVIMGTTSMPLKSARLTEPGDATKADSPVDDKLSCLETLLGEFESVAVAFSGGVDSTLLLRVALETLGHDDVLAVTAQSPSVAARQLEQAKTLARQFGVEHIIIHTGEFGREEYVSNPTNRCYYCKSTLYADMAYLLKRRQLESGQQPLWVIVSGTNADDLGDYRPGLQAAQEFAVRSPLAEAGLTKPEVRTLSRRFDLPTHDQPASPCLSSRIPYGQPVTFEKLRQIEAAEAYLHSLGIKECRVRHHGDFARIEVAPSWFPYIAEGDRTREIDDHFRSLGFSYVTLDLRGFRSGSLNEVILLGVDDGRNKLSGDRS